MEILGIDIGGTSIKIGYFLDHKLIEKQSFPTNGKKGRASVFTSLDNAITTMKKGHNISKIGIVSAGDIDYKNGICLYSRNIVGWTGAPIVEHVCTKFKIPTYLDNDAIGALMGERTEFPSLSDVTMLTFGTGVGGASLIKGKVDRSLLTKWGDAPIFKEKNGRVKTVEEFLSATSLTIYASEALNSRTNTFVLFEKYHAGDEKAVKVVKEYVRKLDILLNYIDEKAHPQMIILGGGLMNAKDDLAPLIKFDKTKYAFASIGNDAGMLGASYLPY
jgi:glucokinase